MMGRSYSSLLGNHLQQNRTVSRTIQCLRAWILALWSQIQLDFVQIGENGSEKEHSRFYGYP